MKQFFIYLVIAVIGFLFFNYMTSDEKLKKDSETDSDWEAIGRISFIPVVLGIGLIGVGSGVLALKIFLESWIGTTIIVIGIISIVLAAIGADKEGKKNNKE